MSPGELAVLRVLVLLPLLLGAGIALADEATTVSPPAEPVATTESAPSRAPLPDRTPVSTPNIAEHEGKVWKMQECGGASNTGLRVGNIAANSVAQVSNRSFLGTLWRMGVTDAAGGAAGKALDDVG